MANQENKQKIIDAQFGEAGTKTEMDADAYTDADADHAFQTELMTSLQRMDVFNDEMIQVPNDFFGLMEQAEVMIQKKSEKKEFAWFIAAALGIMLTVAAAVLVLENGLDVLIIIEAAIFMLMPFSLIPISRRLVRGGMDR